MKGHVTDQRVSFPVTTLTQVTIEGGQAQTEGRGAASLATGERPSHQSCPQDDSSPLAITLDSILIRGVHYIVVCGVKGRPCHLLPQHRLSEKSGRRYPFGLESPISAK